MRIPLAGAVLTALVGLASPAAEAQPMRTPPASGLYESWSSIRMGPVGPLTAPPPAWLPRTVEVVTTGSSSVVTFRPDGRVVWRLTWGPQGVVSKRVLVDGVPWLESRFTYAANGCLREKAVSGRVTREVGAPPAPWKWQYECDAAGRITSRVGTSVQRHAYGSRNLPVGSEPERLAVAWSASGSRASLTVGGRLTRRDDFDSAGRPLRTELFDTARHSLALVYRRDRSGRLRSIDTEKHLGPPSRLGPGARGPVTPLHVAVLAHSTVERFEAELLLGAPTRTSDAGRGADRRITLDWAPDCWLNETSGLEFDPTGLLAEGVQPCICGFCVDAALPVTTRSEVVAVDTHRTTGPWVRLDGGVDVTADHEVMTPDGPRPAGALEAGDVVLDAHGAPRRLRSVARLRTTEPRLGQNVRTLDGTFEAGGILFRSEEPRVCPTPLPR